MKLELLWWTGLVLVLSFVVVSTTPSGGDTIKGRSEMYDGMREFTEANLTSNVKEWSSDLAIMFYAPWCKVS